MHKTLGENVHIAKLQLVDWVSFFHFSLTPRDDVHWVLAPMKVMFLSFWLSHAQKLWKQKDFQNTQTKIICGKSRHEPNFKFITWKSKITTQSMQDKNSKKNSNNI